MSLAVMIMPSVMIKGRERGREGEREGEGEREVEGEREGGREREREETFLLGNNVHNGGS